MKTTLLKVGAILVFASAQGAMLQTKAPGIAAQSYSQLIQENRRKQQQILQVVKRQKKYTRQLLQGILQRDMSQRMAIQVNDYLNRHLYPFVPAGEKRLQRIQQKRKSLQRITQLVLPWAIMEGLSAQQTGRIIAYMFHSGQNGQPFRHSEDIIPAIANKKLSLTDVILLVQYNKESKLTGIPERIRQLFLSQALESMEPLAIWAAGRTLIMAHNNGYNNNQTAHFVLDHFPKKIEQAGTAAVSRQIRRISQSEQSKEYVVGANQTILANFGEIHQALRSQTDPAKRFLTIVRISQQLDNRLRQIKRQSRQKPRKPYPNGKNLIPDYRPPEKKPSPISKKDSWKILDKSLLLTVVREWLDTPYRFGGSSKRGVDCTGFTRQVLIDKRIGVPAQYVPHGRGQTRTGRAISRRQIRAGDLLHFSASPHKQKTTHTGLALSNHRFVHASSSRGVISAKLNQRYWHSRLRSARRLFKRVKD